MFLTGDPECTLDESKNVEGPNRCSMDTECAGARDCSEWGWCEGEINENEGEEELMAEVHNQVLAFLAEN